MTAKEYGKLVKLGAKRIEKDGMFKLVWEDGERASNWHSANMISGFYPSIPPVSEKRLGLN